MNVTVIQPEVLILAASAAGLFGLLIGSFLNVVIYRVPAGISIVSPPSACPNCGTSIRPVDNIPVVSWLMLRGKCRECEEPISPRYPLVELASGLTFAGVTAWAILALVESGPTLYTSAGASAVSSVLELVAFLYLAAVSIALALIDLDTHRLPNAIVLPSYVVAMVLLGAGGLLQGDLDALARAAVGAVAMGGAYFLMALVYPGGMGLGDVKLAGVLGLYLGYLSWGSLIVGAFAAFLLGGLFALVLIATRRAGRKSGIPFGPWMLAGAWIGILFGEAIWNGYLALFGIA